LLLLSTAIGNFSHEGGCHICFPSSARVDASSKHAGTAL
jgi:hypothetical protein